MTHLESLRESHKASMDSYNKQVNDHIDKYGNDGCESLLHRRIMSNYHRGALNALIEVKKLIDKGLIHEQD